MKLLIYCFLFTTSLSNCNKTEMEYHEKFLNAYNSYSMKIEAAGLASIPKASLSESNELYIEYKYVSGQENRNGKMKLQLKSNNHFEGSWETIADIGTVYSGKLYFDFEENGEATGKYEFADSNYDINLQLN